MAWRDWTQAANADYRANLEPTPVSPLDMAEVIRLIDAQLPEGTIFTNGAGNYSGWLHRFHRYTGLHRFGKTQEAIAWLERGIAAFPPAGDARLRSRLVRHYVDDGRLAGWQLAVARHGKVVHHSLYGHRDLAAAWSGSPHGRALTNAALPPERQGCEACHGPGSTHAGSTGKQKLPDLTARDLPAAVATVKGTARSMGIEVLD